MSKKKKWTIDDRWESGKPHHPVAVEILRGAAELDDLPWFKFGGDGDTGEDLLYLVSEWMDREGVTGLRRRTDND